MDGRAAPASPVSLYIQRTDDALWRAQKRVRILPRPKREKREERLEPKERERDGKIVINRRFFMTEEREQRERGRREFSSGRTDGRTSPVKANKMAS